jgi:hypothetical protein
MVPGPPPPSPPANKQEELNEIFVDFLQTRNVYFGADENTSMEYPAIEYHIDDQNAIYANNNPYRRVDAYQITCIDNMDPSVPVRYKVESLNARFVRAYTQDGLYHRVYSLYY